MYKVFICKRFVETCYRRSLFYSTESKIHEIVVTQLGLDHDTVKNIFQNKDNDATKLSEQQITKNCGILKELTVEMQNINSLIGCLKLEPKILINRILLLEEMGVATVTLDYILRFPISMRKTIKIFKKWHMIPSETDVIRSMFNSVGKHDFPTPLKMMKSVRTAEYYMQSMTYYKTFHLKLYYKPLLKSHLLKYQSFRQLTKLIDILRTNFQIDNDFLNRYPFLLNLNPDDVNIFLTEFKDVKIGGQCIHNVVKRYPRILQSDISNVKELLVLFDKYNVQNDTVNTNLQILSMKKDKFIERYNTIANHPVLNVWLKHSRILYLIIAHKLAMDRVDVLQNTNRHHLASFHTIYSTRNYFSRYFTQSKYPRMARKRYLKYLFQKQFGKNGEKYITLIARHPHWRNISFSAMYKMIIYLKSNYTLEDILPNIHLILYPVHAVENMMKLVNKRLNSQNAFTNRQRLALCLYLLEKSYHFSGDAVWKMMYAEKNWDEINPENLEESVNNVNTIDKDLIPYLK